MIIDTHVHFGDPSTPIEALYRTEMPDVYKAVAAPEGVTGVVHVEASGELEENQWILDLAAEEPLIVGMVGRIDPTGQDFGRHLARFAANPLFRGIRIHGLKRSTVDQERFMASMRDLADRGLELDFHGGYYEFDGLLELVRQLPELRIVLNHIGEGRVIHGGRPDPRWQEAIHTLARHPQVQCKVSALVQMTETDPAPADVAFYTPTLDVLWDAFGADRLIYASNWPQIERCSDFPTAHGIAAAYFGRKGTEASEKFFWKNAAVAYNLDLS